jgi:hypothetical protein
MQKAKANFQSQLQDDINAMEFNDSATQDRAKMHEMESFMNNLIDDDDGESDMEEETELTQAKLDELSACSSHEIVSNYSKYMGGVDHKDQETAD